MGVRGAEGQRESLLVEDRRDVREIEGDPLREGETVLEKDTKGLTGCTTSSSRRSRRVRVVITEFKKGAVKQVMCRWSGEGRAALLGVRQSL